MGGLIANDLEKEGHELEHRLHAVLPMPVWSVDLEVEREREVSAAESTVLALIHAGVTDLGELTRAMGMGSDTRLVERVLVKLLGRGALDALGSGFMITRLGDAWRATGSAKGRERVALEVRIDPVLDVLEWVDYEQKVFATAETWTIELPPVGNDELLARKAQVGELVRTQGLPEDQIRAPGERRPPIELRGLAIVSRRTHWREVRLDVWRDPLGGDFRIIGHIGEAEHPSLTRLLTRHELKADCKRIAPRSRS